MMKRIGIVGMLFALFAAQAAFAASAMEKDTLIVATSAYYPPYESHAEDGSLQGFDIDLMAIVGEKLGKKMEWVDAPFDSLIPALMAGKIDLIAAGLSATEERAKRINFSAPYEISYSAFITRPENAPKSLEDMKGKTVAIQTGTVQETFLRGLGTVEVKTFQKFDDCVRDVAIGRADASLMDIPVAKAYVNAKDFAGKVIIAFNTKITGADKAIAMSKKDPELTEAVSKVIEEIAANGELEALRKKWFGE